MLAIYRTLTYVLHPLLPLHLARRARKGKEDAARLGERLGGAAQERPAGKLVWFHAASVGESIAIVPLLREISARYPHLHLLLTTVTVTSAQLMTSHLPTRAIHCYVPIDTPQAVDRFLAHWQPDLALWVESELWPNMILRTQARAIPLFLINGRMSARSAARWQRWPSLIAPMLRAFTAILASSTQDATRFEQLGATRVLALGNLKFSAPPLEAEAAALAQLREQVSTRPCWLAASTHAGEERLVAQVHQALKQEFPQLLTLIVPRHSRRGGEIVQELRALHCTVAQRSMGQEITASTEIYLADTMGELGLFYRVAMLAFIGGSLVPHGGQNPFEAARLGCAVVYGVGMENFTDFCAVLEEAHAARRVEDVDGLTQAVRHLLQDPAQREAQATSALQAVQRADQVMGRVLEILADPLQALTEKHP